MDLLSNSYKKIASKHIIGSDLVDFDTLKVGEEIKFDRNCIEGKLAQDYVWECIDLAIAQKLASKGGKLIKNGPNDFTIKRLS